MTSCVVAVHHNDPITEPPIVRVRGQDVLRAILSFLQPWEFIACASVHRCFLNEQGSLSIWKQLLKPIGPCSLTFLADVKDSKLLKPTKNGSSTAASTIPFIPALQRIMRKFRWPFLGLYIMCPLMAAHLHLVQAQRREEEKDRRKEDRREEKRQEEERQEEVKAHMDVALSLFQMVINNAILRLMSMESDEERQHLASDYLVYFRTSRILHARTRDRLYEFFISVGFSTSSIAAGLNDLLTLQRLRSQRALELRVVRCRSFDADGILPPPLYLTTDASCARLLIDAGAMGEGICCDSAESWLVDGHRFTPLAYALRQCASSVVEVLLSLSLPLTKRMLNEGYAEFYPNWAHRTPQLSSLFPEKGPAPPSFPECAFAARLFAVGQMECVRLLIQHRASFFLFGCELDVWLCSSKTISAHRWRLQPLTALLTTAQYVEGGVAGAAAMLDEILAHEQKLGMTQKQWRQLIATADQALGSSPFPYSSQFRGMLEWANIRFPGSFTFQLEHNPCLL